MKHIFVASLLLTAALSLSAQNSMVDRLKQHNAGEGVVTLHHDVRLERLIGSPHEGAASVDGKETPTMKVAGYRVQVYAGNNSRKARDEANAKAGKVAELFPELAVYTHFQNPRWLCRVGDFRSIEEADAVMTKLKETGQFKEVSIVRGQINITY